MTFDLVFEGGGAKGFGFIGALSAFEERGHQAGRLIGTSAGAIVATLLAVGYTAAGMRKLFEERVSADGIEKLRVSMFLDPPDARQFRDDLQETELARRLQSYPELGPLSNISKRVLLQVPLYAHMFSLLEFGGWYVGDSFTDWLRDKLDEIGKDVKLSECSLRQFHERTNKDLSLIASDTSVGEMLVLNHRTAPDCPVVAAVRMSMSFPFIWQEVIWREEWGKYRGRWKAGNVIADGGLLSNFPIHLLVKPPVHQYIREIMGEGETTENANFMGLLLDHNRALDVAGTVGSESSKDHRLLHRPLRLLNTVLGAYDFDFIEENDDYICRIPVQGYGVTDFELSEMRLQALIGSGYNAMFRHLQKVPSKLFSPAQSSLKAATS